MRYSVAVLTAPVAEPLTVAQAKLHLRVDVDDDNALIAALIQAAREWVENYTRRSMVARTLQLRMDCFLPEILLPRGPVISVSSVKYTAQDGTLTTISSSAYQTDLYSTPARVMPVFGSLWPVPKYGTLNAVVVEYLAGYAESGVSPTDLADTVPAAMKVAMKLLIGHWYTNREAVVLENVQATEVPMAVKSVLAPFEIRDYCLE